MVNQENTRDQKKFEIIISVFPSLYFCCLLQISTNFSIYFRKKFCMMAVTSYIFFHAALSPAFGGKQYNATG